MKSVVNILAVAILLGLTTNTSFALWDHEIVSKERARELGMEVRSTANGPGHVQVELEFKVEGELKNFSHVDLLLRKGDDLVVRAPLHEDRSKPGHVAVTFTADRTQLDNLILQVEVPFRDGGAGGTIHELRVKSFVETKKAR